MIYRPRQRGRVLARARVYKELEIAESVRFLDRAEATLLLNELRHQRRPAGLMGGSKTGAIIAIEIFMEPARIVVGRSVERTTRTAKTRSLTLWIAQE